MFINKIRPFLLRARIAYEARMDKPVGGFLMVSTYYLNFNCMKMV